MSMTAEAKKMKPAGNVLLSALQGKAATDAVFNAVMHRFALRERARAQVTIASLRIAMSKEGYTYKREDYERVLMFLADQGVGQIERNKNGQVTVLKNIKVTLQSLGAAAVQNGTKSVAPFTPANTFHDIPVPTSKIEPETAPAYPQVTVLVEGRLLAFPLPRALTMDELGDLIVEVYGNKNKSRAKVTV